MKKYKFIIRILIVVLMIVLGSFGIFKVRQKAIEREMGIGNILDSYKGVDIYYNGEDYTKNYGKNKSKDGYYYGYKWQCVEYVKRFYYEAKGHKMPDVYGNARDFFDENVEQGALNEKRDLIQYRNGGDEKPREDDLLVFTDTQYGHVVIISEVGDDYIEVVQQNMGDESRDKFNLECIEGKYFIGGSREPAGWLRKE